MDNELINMQLLVVSKNSHWLFFIGRW
jgi:hypothetical protein